MKKLILTSAIALALAGCDKAPVANNNTDTNQQQITTEQKQVTSGIDMTAMDLAMKPGNDFDDYVNGEWTKSAVIPGDKARIGVFTTLADRASEDVRDIIETAASSKAAQGSDEQKVGDMFAAYTNWDQRNALGIKPLQADLKAIQNIKTASDLAAVFGQATVSGIDAPIGMYQYVDLKDPSTYSIYTTQGGLGLPDREYYLKDDKRNKDIRSAYVDYMIQQMSLASVTEPVEKAAMIMKLETRLAKLHQTKEESRDTERNYNSVALDQLKTVMPDFDWDAYLKAAGLTGKVNFLVITSLDYTKALDKVLKDVSIDDWKTYLTWKMINAKAGELTQSMDQARFDFYSGVLRGVEEQKPMWKRGVAAVNGTLGEIVGKVYVEKHFPAEAKAKMEELVANLIKGYEISIKNLDWMSPETKVQALDKLHKFTPKIGYPDKWKDYSDLTITADNLYANYHSVAVSNWNKKLARQGQKVDRSEWGMSPQTVNAYYNPPLNEIVFPAAILQPPFFNLDADDAVNYGAIGGVIGHEIGHGFDDKGSTFDGNGVLRNWWTDEDRKQFEARTDKLVAQYDGYKPFPVKHPDVHVNGNFTLGENIGDLGGLSIALKAYHLSLDGQQAPTVDGFTGDQRVLMGWAQVWRAKYREKAVLNQIETDPHSPAHFRINGVVRNIPEFYSAFDVQPGDKLYLAPEDRVKIW